MNNNEQNQHITFSSLRIPIDRILDTIALILIYGVIIVIFLIISKLSSNLLFALIFLPMGLIFFLNGIVLLRSIGQKSVGIINAVVAVLVLFPALILYWSGFTVILVLIVPFSILYFMFSGVFIYGYDAKGLGWYCLFATVVFIWYGYHFYILEAVSPGFMYYGIFYWAWALLVFLAFLVFSLGKALGPAVAWLLIIESILTLIIPGLLLLIGKWDPIDGLPL